MPGQWSPGEQCPCGSNGTCQCDCAQCEQVRAANAAGPHFECTRCARSLPEASYGRRSSGTRQSWCRECGAAHARARRATAGTTPRRAAGRSRSVAAFDRPFGLEIEVIHQDMRQVADAMRAAGLECQVESYSHATRTHWKIVPDGSVERGFEIVSPILRGSAGRAEARRAFEALRAAGADIDRSCGLHVHHDAGDLTAGDLARLVSTWRAEQGLIDGFVAPSRRGQSAGWCYPLDARDESDAADLASTVGDDTRLSRTAVARVFGDARSSLRYRTLNFRVFSLHGTVEVRQHQGTLNATKALSWVMLGQAYLARCKETPTVRHTVTDLLADLESVGLEPIAVAYLADRAAAFAGGRVSV